ncbi:von Willebrand factor A domain-containing protein 5A-like [Oncorhynchus nerka]|uniref:von Willebrand factor A domain-containing protein 5A-like n=1 Tax=Oncorhynchus nerka TaxID=8023 RepID=UPI0031B8829F
MLSLYPEFPKDVMSSMTSHREFLIVVDHSGSIEYPIHNGSGSQDRIGSARLFLFTDGEVGNTKEVLDLVKTNAGSHRCFSFGVGEGASTALISGVAKQARGHAQFITGQDRMQPKVMQSLRFALQPAVVDISVKWNVPKEVSVTLLSPPIRVVFQGQRALLYAQLTREFPIPKNPPTAPTTKRMN